MVLDIMIFAAGFVAGASAAIGATLYLLNWGARTRPDLMP